MAASLTISRAALRPALSAAVKAIERRNTMPILGNVLVSAEAAGITITATDLDIQVTSRAEARIDAPGSFTVSGDALSKLVERFSDKAEITIEPADRPGAIVVRSGRSRATLHTLPVDEFPELTVANGFEHRFTTTGAALARLLGKVEFAISDEETRYYLNGTLLHVLEIDGIPTLRTVATDGSRLAHCEMPAPDGLSPHMPRVIVPTKACAEIKRLCADTGDKPLTVEVSSSKLRVEAGTTRLVTKLIDGTFPDYERVIPRGNPSRIRVETGTLAAALGRAIVMSSPDRREVKFAFDDGTLRITAKSPDHGDILEEMEVDQDGPPITIGFNGKFLGEILPLIGADTFQFRLGDPGSPAVIQTDDEADTLFVLMPMRV